jgi:hypothetical protein
MEVTSTNKSTNQTAIVGVYGPTGAGKTACLATALPLGDMLYCMFPGEGDGSATLRDYDIPMLRINTYGQLMALYAALIGNPEWKGDESDLPLIRPIKGDKRLSGFPKADEIKELVDTFGKLKLKTIAFDAGQGMQQLFSQHSIEYWGKDLGIGRYGDIADLTRATLLKFGNIPGILMVIWVAFDKQIVDEGRGITYREMAFEGNKSREIVPPACNFVLPIFTGEELKLDKPEWDWEYKDIKEKRDRWFLLRPSRGFWAKARGPLSINAPATCKADLARLYKAFYAIKPKEVKTSGKDKSA